MSDSSDFNGVIETRNGVFGRFELDCMDEMVPIEQHPDRDFLMQAYGGRVESGRLVFDPTYSASANSGLSGGASGSLRNPKFGVRFAPILSAVFRHVQVTQSVPTDIWESCGKVIQQLPAGFPNPSNFLLRRRT